MNGPESSTGGELNLNGRVIFRVGIGLVMVGMIYLFRYSIEQGWFGPLARVGAGAVASAALIGAGLTVSRRDYGRLMQGAGVAGAYATAWAAHGRYALVDETTAFVQMVAVAAAGIGLAWRERSDVLSALGMAGAVVAPLMIGGHLAGQVGEVVYQVVVLGAASALLYRCGWWITQLVAVAGTGLALGLHALADPAGVVLGGVMAWWAAGWLLPKILAAREGSDIQPDMVAALTAPVPVATWAIAAIVIGDGAAPAGIAAVVHATAWWWRRQHAESVVDLLFGIGFATLGLALAFDADVAIPVYLLLTAAVAVFGSRTGQDVPRLVGLVAGAAALPGWATLIDDGGRLTTADAVGDLAGVVIVAVAAFLLRGADRSGAGVVAYVMALVWIARYPGAWDPGWATAGFAVVALVSLIGGRLTGSRLLVGAGLGTMGLAVLKLILVDLATADPLLKVGLAFGIGLSLLGVGYWIGDSSILDRPRDSNPAEHVSG